MIILILLGLIVIGGIFAVWYGKNKADWTTEDGWTGAGAILILIGALGLLIGGIPAICMEIEEPMMYENKMEQYEMLTYRLEHQEDNLVGNEQLYFDIVSFNAWIRSNRRWANNPFINVWHYQDCADIPTIDYQRGD